MSIPLECLSGHLHGDPDAMVLHCARNAFHVYFCLRYQRRCIIYPKASMIAVDSPKGPNPPRTSPQRPFQALFPPPAPRCTHRMCFQGCSYSVTLATKLWSRSCTRCTCCRRRPGTCCWPPASATRTHGSTSAAQAASRSAEKYFVHCSIRLAHISITGAASRKGPRTPGDSHTQKQGAGMHASSRGRPGLTHAASPLKTQILEQRRGLTMRVNAHLHWPLGELGLLHDHPRSCSVVATREGSSVWVLERRAFRWVADADAEMRYINYRYLTSRHIGQCHSLPKQIAHRSDWGAENMDQSPAVLLQLRWGMPPVHGKQSQT